MFAILPTLPHHCLSSFPSVIQVHLPPAYPLNQTWVFYPCYLAHSPPSLPLLSRSTSLPLILIPVMAAFLSLPRNFKVSHTTHYSLLTTQVWGRCALHAQCASYTKYTNTWTSGRSLGALWAPTPNFWWLHRTQMKMMIPMMMITSYTDDND